MGKQAGSVLANIINVPHTKAQQVIISSNMEKIMFGSCYNT